MNIKSIILKRFFKLEESDRKVFFIGGLLGLIVFYILYGIKILDVTYVDWIFLTGDPTQHYFGWEFFRKSPWMFPWGLTDSLSYPHTSSVVFTDSIPHLAIFFKLFNSILPTHFQYLGLYGLFCYIMQGACSAYCIIKITKDTFYAILGSLFFIFCPCLIQRCFFHTALSSHFIIILSIYFCFFKKKFTFKQEIIIWTIMLWYAVGVHIYLWVMCVIFLGIHVLLNFHRQKIHHCFFICIIPFLTSIATLYVLGVFSATANPTSSANASCLGYYSANINALINPTLPHFSSFLSPLHTATPYQYEGFSYLGMGGIILTLISIGIFSTSYFYKYRHNKDHSNKTKVLIYILSIILFFIIALSNRITLGDRILFEWTPPKPILWCWEIVRATGRFMWPVVYLIWTGVLFLLFRSCSTPISLLIVLACFSIQMIDIFPGLREHCIQATTLDISRKQTPPKLPPDFLLNKKRVCYSRIGTIQVMYKNSPILQFANDNSLYLNGYYFARFFNGYYDTITNRAHREICNPNDTTIYYICNEKDNFINDTCLQKLQLYTINDYIWGIKK